MRFVQRAKPDIEAAAQLETAGFSPLLSSILSARGIYTAEQAKSFLAPEPNQLHDPYLLHDMKAAVERIREAVEKKQRIVIFGDYDVDGVTATAVMLSYLRDLGARAGYYMPNRHGEGYGLNEAAVRSLAGAYELMITVDCGITSTKEITIAKECGLDVIVTDHHEPTSDLPDCPCVNPKLGYPFTGLCGAGVAGKVVQAMGGIEALTPLLDLIALGTIADIVPLVDENRVLAALGLAEMNRLPRPGINALAEVAGLLGKELNSGHMSFLLAPRINAGGRMGHSGRSVEMLLEKNRDAAMDIARDLDESNRQRQETERKIMEEALLQAEKTDLRVARCLVLTGEGWNPGVIGIVASRLVERFSRPVFLLSKEGNVCVGSGRSVPGVNLFQALDAMASLFIRYGGHEMAAGLTISFENVPSFESGLQGFFEEYPAELFLPTMLYDIETNLSALNRELINDLERLAPTGQGNNAPVFLLRDVSIANARTMGSTNAHLRMRVHDKKLSFGAVAFKMGDRLTEASGCVDALVTPEIGDYMGEESVRLVIRAFIASSAEFATEALENAERLIGDFFATIPYGEASAGFMKYLPMRDVAQLKETAKRLLRQTPGGVLIQCALPETAIAFDRWLTEEGLSALVLRNIGTLREVSGAPHTLQLPAQNGAEALDGYKHILLADGFWGRAWLQKLLKHAPNAIVYAPPLVDEAVTAVKERLPDVEMTRNIYRSIVKKQEALRAAKGFDGFYHTLGADFSPATVRIALAMLLDMELIEWSEEPFRFALKKAKGKKNAELTSCYQFFKEMTEGGKP